MSESYRNAEQAGSATSKVASSTVVKALHVLDCLAQYCQRHPSGAAVRDLATASGESPSSVCKHLAAFLQIGMVEQDPDTSRYRLGSYNLYLSAIALQSLNIRDIASPHLQQLAAWSKETVHLVIREGLRVVYIDKIESPKTIRMHSYIGLRNPLYCTGVGKALLAWSPLSVLDACLADAVTAFTPYTLTSREALLADLDAVRKRGYALDAQEHELEVSCVAAPIFNHRGEAIASCSVAGPSSRMTSARLHELGKYCRDTAARISQLMGHR